jgi:hypothetical protein
MEWWHRHSERTGLVEVEVVEKMPDGRRAWLDWKKGRLTASDDGPALCSDIQVLEADPGRSMGFIRMIARSR